MPVEKFLGATFPICTFSGLPQIVGHDEDCVGCPGCGAHQIGELDRCPICDNRLCRQCYHEHIDEIRNALPPWFCREGHKFHVLLEERNG